jgi:YVTN family beta-propeller protein
MNRLKSLHAWATRPARGWRLTRSGLGALVLAAVAQTQAQTIDQPARAVTDPGVVTTRQLITPAGVPSVFQGKLNGVAFGATPDEIYVLGSSHLYRLNWRENRVVEKTALGGRPGMQGLRYAGKPIYAAVQKGEVKLAGQTLGRTISAGVAVAAGTTAVAMTFDNTLAVAGGAGVKTVKTGIAPFGVAISKDGSVAYVSNWGGRFPKPGEKTAPTGLLPTADQVVVDDRGIAATGTVVRVDLKTMTVTAEIATGLHPMGIAWDEARNRLYVANANSDSVTVIDTGAQKVAGTISLQSFDRPAKGIAPNAVAVSGDGKRLFVTCGGINAIAVADTAKLTLDGLIPTAWYPNALDLSSDGKRLAVASLLGAGSGWRDDPRKRYVHSYRGSVAVIDLPDSAQLASYTAVVAENNRMALKGAPVRAAAVSKTRAAKAVPERSGEPSLIEHVVYIVKENRTYDQVFGDLPRGNGDPSLVMFGEDVAPNHRKLAQQFVLLDNFYATGGNSADGHQWVTQANELAYTMWPGYEGRSYPFDGTDPIAYSSGGFIWDAALKAGKSVRIYGQYAGRLAEPQNERQPLLERWRNGEKFLNRWNITAPIEPVNKVLARNYPTYSNSIPDLVRADIFLEDLKKWSAEGRMPNLTILQLPCDHTFGTSPGVSTPRAMVADNDWALGRIVEGLSRSPFWNKMAIFVVEDDAQNGVDHVDGHRTVALAISPYVRRNHVDSTFYAHQSMLKTMELMLGLPALTLFDMIAFDMRESFGDTPDLTGYTAVEPKQSLMEQNPARSALRGQARRDAIDSARMRWEVPDAVPSDRLNRIIWRSTRGAALYPGVKNAVFAPLSLDLEDEEREDRR